MDESNPDLYDQFNVNTEGSKKYYIEPYQNTSLGSMVSKLVDHQFLHHNCYHRHYYHNHYHSEFTIIIIIFIRITNI